MRVKDFLTIFFKPELISILSRRILIFILIAISFLALFSIGFSSTAKYYLKARMDNPFVKFISVDIPTDDDNIESVRKFLNNDSLKSKFGYSEFSELAKRNINLLASDELKLDGSISARNQAVNNNDSLYKFILSDNSIQLSDTILPFSSHPFGIIVTKRILNRLGYFNINTVSHIKMILAKADTNLNNQKDTYIILPINGVVDELPDKLDVLMGVYLYKSIIGSDEDSEYSNVLDINSSDYADENSVFIHSNLDSLSMLNSLKQIGIEYPNLSSSDNHLKGWCFTIKNFNDSTNSLLTKKMGSLKPEKIYNYISHIDLSSKNEIVDDASKMMFVFNNLDSVKQFQEYMFNQYEWNLDMNTVEAKSNFNVISKISNILSFILYTTNVLLIIYVLTSIIFEHIEKNKQSLGTLKAFGLSNYTITIVYSSIAFVISSTIFGLSFILVKLIGSPISSYIIKDLNVKDFIFNINFDFMVIVRFVLMPVFIIAILIFNKLYNKTPGDLIYERDK